MSDPAVLLVDDDAPIRRMLERTLVAEGYAVAAVADGGAALAELADGAVDLLFLDAERTEYPAWWPHPARVLRPGGVLVADNALSHPAEIAPLRDLVEAEPGLVSTTIGVGKGELVALRG